MDPEVEALYGLPLDEFTAARNALAKARTKAGDKEGAAAVKALRKPSVVAWALNQLVRRHPDDVDALLDTGARLRRAQTAALEGGDPAELREASRAEAAEVQALAGQARSILADANRGGSAAQEERLAATLRAAAVDHEAGDLLRRGVLTEELSPAGFGFGVGEGDVEDALAPVSLTSDRSASRSQQKERREAEAAERQRRRELDAELRAAREQAHRLEREADKAEERAREARQAAVAAAARVAELEQAQE